MTARRPRTAVTSARALAARRLITRWRRAACGPAANDHGAVVFWIVPIMAGLIALTGLVVDGGNALAAREQAADLSEQAARAGADALSPLALHDADPSQLTADPAAARAAVLRVLTPAGITDPTVTIEGDSVTVTVTVHRDTQILSIVGLDQLSGSASATATALHGTAQGGTG